ncbi:MAG: AMIN domain-containing protein [bacterium]|nr:AMIN domain-containing protein [bacterium]
MRRFITFLLLVFLILSSVKFALGEGLANVNWYLEGDKLIIDLKASTRVTYTSFTLTNPTRLVIDVYNVTLSKSQSFEINKSPIRVLRMAPRDNNKLRMTLETNKIPKYQINLLENGVRLLVVAQLDVLPVSALLRKIIYGNNNVSIYTSSSCKFKSILDDNPPRFIMEFPSVSFGGKVESIAQSTIVNRVIAYDYEDVNKNVNTVVVIELRDKIEPVVTEDRSKNIIQLSFGKEPQNVTLPSTRTTIPIEQVKKSKLVTPEKRVSLSFKDADIKDVLQALSIKAGVNIIIDEGVSRKITLVLNNVTAKEALEMITKASGLAYEKWDNGYIVATPKRLLEVLDSGIPKEPKQVVEAIEIKGDAIQIQNTIKVVYPDIVSSISGRYIVLRGEVDKVTEAKKLISSIDTVPVKPEVKELVEAIEIKGDAIQIQNAVKALYADIVSSVAGKYLILKGDGNRIAEAKKLISTIDIAPISPVIKEVVEVVEIRGSVDRVSQSIKGVYPELVVISGDKVIVVKGEENKVRQAIELAKRVDVAPIEEAKAREVVRLKGIEANAMKEALSGISEVSISVVKQTNTIILQGSKSKVEEIKRLISILDVEPVGEQVKQVVEAIEIKGDAIQIQNTIKVVYPDIVSSISGRYIVLRGEVDKVKEAKKLVTTIDVVTVTPEIIAKTTELTERIALKHIEAKDFLESIKGLFPQDTLAIEAPTNTLIVRGTRDVIDRVQEFVAVADVPTPQYMLEAKVVEVNRDGALLLGVDSSLSANLNVGLSTNALSLESLTSLVSSTVQLNAVLSMAQSKGLAKVIASPKIAAIDGKEANIFIGDVINYFIPNVEGGFDLKSVTAGVTLRVTAKMERDKTIRVTLNPEVSSITGWTGSGATIAPNVGTRRASTELKVKDGDTIIIGGLMRSSDTETVKKVPLLSNIPILGQLFKSRDTKQEERELIIMITVNVVKEEK